MFAANLTSKRSPPDLPPSLYGMLRYSAASPGDARGPQRGLLRRQHPPWNSAESISPSVASEPRSTQSVVYTRQFVINKPGERLGTWKESLIVVSPHSLEAVYLLETFQIPRTDTVLKTSPSSLLNVAPLSPKPSSAMDGLFVANIGKYNKQTTAFCCLSPTEVRQDVFTNHLLSRSAPAH